MKKDEIKNYIRGRLAEAIVEQLYKRAGYVILRYGYESIAQNLVQGSDWHTISRELEIVESAPDFIVKDSDKFLYFLEVKYRSKFNKQELEKTLEKQTQHWKRTHVIVMTPEEPFFTMMYRYNHSWETVALEKFRRADKISKELLEKFKSIVQDFFQKSSLTG